MLMTAMVSMTWRAGVFRAIPKNYILTYITKVNF